MQVGFSFSQLIVRAARIERAEDAVVFGRVRTSSWRATLERVQRFAGALKMLGVEADDRVAMLALNSDLYLQYYFAVPWAGGVLVPINTRLAPAEVVHWLNDSGARVLLVDESFVPVIEQIKSQLESVEKFVYVGENATPSGFERLDDLLAAAQPVEDAGRSGDDLVALFYTGGTTGQSKGVMLTHNGVITNTLQWCVSIGVSAEDHLLIVAPMFHMVAGLNSIATAMLAARVSILPRFDPEVVLAHIQDFRVTKIAVVPTMIHALLHHPNVGRYDLSSLRKISYGGSPMSLPLLERALELLPQAQFYQIYGQTEGGPNISCLSAEYHDPKAPDGGKMKSAGCPIPGVEVTIRDEDDNEVPPGVVGEICVRSPAVSPGYWRRPEETAFALRNGILHTGDAGYMDEDGFIYIVDRLKDMIISGGENVYSAEVEAVLYKHPAVAECVVIGIPHDVWGEQVHAIVRVHEGKTVTEEELIAHCRNFLAGFKCVRSVTFRTEPFPLSGANKILKRELRKPFWEGRERKI